MKRITKTSITISFFVLFTVSFLIQSFLFIGVSQAQVNLSPKYIRTGEGWDGAKINNQNIYIAWQKQNPKIIAFFEQSGNGLYKQRPTYYSLPEGSFVAECPSWIQNQNLYTQDKSTADGGCEPDWANSPYDRGDNKGFVNIKFDVPEFKNLSELYNLKAEVFTPDLQKYIRERNYFEVPYGCPGAPEPSRGTRNGLVASANAVYACPGADGSINTLINGVINKGKFEKVDDQTWNQILNDAIAEDAKGEEVTGTEGEKCTDQLTPFGWVLCPVIGLADGLYEFMQGLVNDLLFVDQKTFNDSRLKDAWGVFVSIANFTLVLIGLVIIASQIFNFEFVSAYTVKKALPRLVIGAILIQLSWFIFTNLIVFVNSLGVGIYSLILSPFNLSPGGQFVSLLDVFRGAGDTITQEDGSLNTAINVIVGTTSWVALGFAIKGAWATIILIMMGAVVSILISLIVIILREGLILVLLVLSPIALAMWILPGTNKSWSLWWNNYSRLLLMYPLIMLLFAAGTIMAYLLADAGGAEFKIFAILAYFIPLFLIGFTFKFAGSGLASISKLSGKLNAMAKGSNMLGMKKIAENQKSSRDYERKIRGLDWASSENRLIRTFGRLQSGTAGARGSYAGKLRQAERAENLKSANEEMAEVVQSLNPGEVRGFQEDYLGARVGDTVPVGANGQEITVTRRLQEAMILQAAQSRNQRAIDAYRNMLATTGDEAATESFNRIINSNFDTFDSIMPDLTRGADIQLTPNAAGNLDPSRSFQKAVSSYDSIGEDRQSQLLAEFARLQNGSTEDRMLLAGYLTTIASSERVSEQDFLTLSTRIGAGLNLAAVRTSKGKITVGIDGAGNLVTEGDGPMEVTVV